MHRAYADLSDPEGTRQIHYRESGSGPSLVMLHPSPLSSASLSPQISILASEFRCIAWDTPGYGNSDPLPARYASDGSLNPYVESLSLFLDALSLETALIYGSATGAQIGVEFANRYPERCSGLILDNAAIFDESEAQTLLQGYFPDIAAQDDGNHLNKLWTMAKRSTRYFPWYADGPAAEKRSAYPPAPIVDGIVRDYLSAGPGYDRAYRAAFANERPDRLQALTVPTLIQLWDEGLLGEYGDRVESLILPANVQTRRASAGIEARMTTLLESARALAAQ